MPTEWIRVSYHVAAAFRRTEAKLAAFRAWEKSLPPAARAYPACEPFEQRFGYLDCDRLAACAVSSPPPRPTAPLSLKPVLSEVEGLDLLVADQAWEPDSAEAAFAALRADARRLLGGCGG